MVITHVASFASGPIIQSLLTVEKAVTIAIDDSEEVACIIEVKDEELKEQIDPLVHQLCAALLIQKNGGVM